MEQLFSIGGFSLTGRYGNIWGVASGAIFVYTIQTGMSSLQLPGELQTLVNGFLIILTVYPNHIFADKKMELEKRLSDISSVRNNQYRSKVQKIFIR